MAAFRSLASWLRGLSRQPWALVFFAGMFLVSQLSILVVLAPVGFDAVWQMQTTMSADTFSAVLADVYARDAAEDYIAHFYYDFLHPVWYSVLLVLLLGRAMDRAGWPAGRDAWLLIPLLAGVLDQVQNALHFYMVMDTANIAPVLVQLGNGAGLLKMAVIGLPLLALPVLWLSGSPRPTDDRA